MKEYDSILGMKDREGSYLTGAIGALLGSMVGAALWLLVSYFGFYAYLASYLL